MNFKEAPVEDNCAHENVEVKTESYEKWFFNSHYTESRQVKTCLDCGNTLS